jgi:chemotaxis protein CheD
MNHFVIHQGGQDEPLDRQHRYGDTAMRSLVDRLRRRGARPEQMLAKLYGGRLRKEDGSDPGALNSYFAQAFLQDEGIRLIEASLGDHVARWVTFHPVSGRVVLKETGDITFAA